MRGPRDYNFPLALSLKEHRKTTVARLQMGLSGRRRDYPAKSGVRIGCRSVNFRTR